MLSWNSVFAFGPWLRIPVIILSLLFVLALIRLFANQKINYYTFRFEDTLLLLFITFYTLSAIINTNKLCANYILAYVYTLLISYILFKILILEFISMDKLYKANFFGVLLSSSFIVLNFCSEILLSFSIQEWLPRYKDATATITNNIFTLYRGYGFSSEPGVACYYLNVLGPIAIWFLFKKTNINKAIKISLLIIIIFGWFLTFSAAGIFIMLLISIVTYLMWYTKYFIIKKKEN